jgi:hypothetical protein
MSGLGPVYTKGETTSWNPKMGGKGRILELFTQLRGQTFEPIYKDGEVRPWNIHTHTKTSSDFGTYLAKPWNLFSTTGNQIL